jgi:Spy/CpxP family protein refolding chaperone
MKIKALAFAMIAMLTLALSLPVFAQDAPDQTPPPQGRGMRGHHGPPSVDDQLNHLNKMLSLTDDQKTKIKPFLQDQQNQMSALRQDSSLSRQDRMSKMQQIHQNTTQQVKSVLNEDQQKKYDEMQSRMRRGWRDHQGGQNQGSSGNPPPPPDSGTPQQ